MCASFFWCALTILASEIVFHMDTTRIQRHDAIETSKIPIVVIIGASFSGISALTHLYPHVRVIVIDSKDYFEYYPGILVSMTGKRLDQMIQPLKSFVEPYGRFIQGYFTSIEPKSKLVHIQTLTGEISSLKYDALLLCCGVPYSLPIKSSTQSMEKRKEELLSFSSKVQGYKRIAIIGGGLIGVELAAELYQHVPSTQLLIFTSEDRLLPTLPVSAGNVAQKWLSKCGVEIIFRAKIDSILHDSPEMFYQLKTSSGDSYSVDYVINCTGITSLVSDQYRTPPAEKIVDVSKMETTLRTHRGTIVTNSHFQPIEGTLAGADGVFVCGDLADIREERNPSIFFPHWAAQLGRGIKSGFVAEIQAELAAQNILQYCSHTSGNMISPQYYEYPKSKFYTSTPPLIACVTLGRVDASYLLVPHPSANRTN